MLATVDGSDDQGFGVEVPPVDLAAVGQLEEALSDFYGSPVHFIEEECHRSDASRHEPVWGVPGSSLAPTDLALGAIRQTEQIALGHLGGSTLHDRQTTRLRNLIDDLRLADTMTTTHQDRQPMIEDRGRSFEESCEVYGHVCSPRGTGGVVLIYDYIIDSFEKKVKQKLVKRLSIAVAGRVRPVLALPSADLAILA
jgi:hypothetical protein